MAPESSATIRTQTKAGNIELFLPLVPNGSSNPRLPQQIEMQPNRQLVLMHITSEALDVVATF